MTLLMASCSSAPKKVPYLVDAEKIPAEVLAQTQTVADPIIGPGDLLNIDVWAPDMAAVTPFNKGRYVDSEGRLMTVTKPYSSYTDNGPEISTDYYLVNADGTIDFPVIGKIEVAGLSKRQVVDKIANEIYPKYLTEKPTVEVRLMNFRVSVLGAVKTPGIYRSSNERMTFLEAISRAGDLDIKGDRENILLYRTNSDGSREIKRINLQDRDFLLSPYFTLQQNDIIYVQPNKSLRAQAWSLSPGVTSTITIIGGISSLASLVVGVINLTKN